MGGGRSRSVARRNLLWSVAAEHVGFSVWSLWSVMVLFMPQSGLRAHRGGQVLDRRYRDAGRLGAAVALHDGDRAVRRPQLDRLLRLRSGCTSGRDDRRCSRTPVDRCGSYLVCAALMRPGRRQLRFVDDQHQRVFPAAPQGRGAGHERGRREYRCSRRATGRSVRDRGRGQPAAVLGVRVLPGGAGDRRDRGGPVHGQPRRGVRRHRRHARRAAQSAYLAGQPAVHRHLWLFHRILVRVRPGAADVVRRRAVRARHRRHCTPPRSPSSDRCSVRSPGSTAAGSPTGSAAATVTLWAFARHDRRRRDPGGHRHDCGTAHDRPRP